MVYDRCYPAILPEISFLSVEDKHIIHIRIYRGSTPPYYLKSEGKLKGTYIRVGSNNRLADESIIADLERNRRNVSFDCEIVLDKTIEELDIERFRHLYKAKTGDTLDIQVLRKLELVKKEQEREYPTNALVLFSDDALRFIMFPNAKIECARFKGNGTEEFIDQKSITVYIGAQAEEAYNFVLRHINKGAMVKGVYTISRWEYPIKAIREIIRNAVVHRQYSLTGKDIKVAIYDDMVEITSPGLLPPSIDYADMGSRQSDARNKVIAPVFKRLGIIDQWGNGLKLVAEEMKEYPDIKLHWKEVGLSFQVQFIKKSHTGIPAKENSGNGGDIGGNGGNTGGNPDAKNRIIALIALNDKISVQAIADNIGVGKRNCERIIAELKKAGVITRSGSARAGRWNVIVNRK
jgi:predicted HTH transcriptional regulator